LSTDSTVITRDRSALWITINRANDLNALAKTKAGFTQTQGLPNKQSWEVEIGIFRDFLLNDPMAAEGFNSYKEGRKPNWL